MINVNDILTVGGVLVGVCGGMIGVVPYFKRKGIDGEGMLKTAEGTLTASEPLIQVAKTIPSLKSGAAIVDFMEQKAKSGVKAAEQLYHAGTLQSNEDRFKSAQETVYNSLKEINITPSDNQKKLIDDFIQEAVNDLGHAPIPDAEKNAQIAKAQQDLAATQAENTQLQQKLATIQNTATV